MLARGGSSLRDAVRHQWSLNALAVPLACAGAFAGYLAVDAGWWLAIPVLLPVPWIPELVLVRARRVQRATPSTQVRLLAGVTIAVALAAATVIAWSSGARSSPVLVVLAVALGAELRVSAARAVPPLAAIGVAATVIVDGSGVLLMAGLVGATTTATAWVLARNARVVPASLAILGAAIGGIVCGAAVFAAPTGDSPVTEVLSVALGAALFSMTAVLANGPRRDAWGSLAWAAPVLLVAVLLASAWNELGAPGALVFAVGVGGSLAGFAWVAAPPWSSRVLGRVLGSRVRCRLRSVIIVVAVAAVTVACVATQADSARPRAVFALVAAALAETVVAITLGVVRQWRFAPRPRARTAVALGVLGTLVVVAYLPLASAGAGWSIVVLTGVLGAATVTAWPLARFADSGTPAR